MRHAPLCSIIVLLATTGCSAHGSSAAAGRNSSASGCSTPTAASSIELVDSAGLVQALSGHSQLSSSAGDTIVFSITYDAGGDLRWLRLSHPEASVREHARIEAVLRGHVGSAAAPGASGWGVLIRGERLEAGLLDVREECDPRFINRHEVRRELQAAAAELGLRRGRASIRLLTDANGAVRLATVHESSGNPRADQMFREVARTARFSPQRLNGLPVPSWVSVPLGLEDR